MQHIRFLAAVSTAVSVLALTAACAPAPAPVLTAVGTTAAPTATPVPAPSTPTATAVPPTVPATATLALATSTKVTASATVSVRPRIPANFPLAIFAKSDRDGKWTESFGPDGTYQVTLNGRVAVSGTFIVREDLLILYDASGSKACTKDDGGVYKWTFDGTDLAAGSSGPMCRPSENAVRQFMD